MEKISNLKHFLAAFHISQFLIKYPYDFHFLLDQNIFITCFSNCNKRCFINAQIKTENLISKIIIITKQPGGQINQSSLLGICYNLREEITMMAEELSSLINKILVKLFDFSVNSQNSVCRTNSQRNYRLYNLKTTNGLIILLLLVIKMFYYRKASQFRKKRFYFSTYLIYLF